MADTKNGGGTDAISEGDVKRFLDLIEAVRAKDALDKAYTGQSEKPELDQLDSVFGFEVISALTGRTGSERDPFGKTLAKITRSSRTLTITEPEVAEGSKVEVRPLDGKPESAAVGASGVVTLTTVTDLQEIVGVVVRDRDDRPLAVAGRIPPVAASIE